MKNTKNEWFSVLGSKTLHIMYGNRTACRGVFFTKKQMKSIVKKKVNAYNRCPYCLKNLRRLQYMEVSKDNEYMKKHYDSIGADYPVDVKIIYQPGSKRKPL